MRKSISWPSLSPLPTLEKTIKFTSWCGTDIRHQNTVRKVRAHNLHMQDLKVSWFSHIRKPTSKFHDRVKFLTRIRNSKKYFFQNKPTLQDGTTEGGKLKTWTRRTKSDKKPIQSTSNWIGWFFFYMKKISYWLKLISYHSYHILRPYGF